MSNKLTHMTYSSNHHYKKYNFNSKEEAENHITNLGTFEGEGGEIYPLHRHTIVKLGFLLIEDAIYDEDGNEISPAIHSDKYSVDVLWKELPVGELDEVLFPEGWSEKELIGLENYKHNFYGYTYEE